MILFLVPQINCNIRQKWNVSLLADMPVYKKYNGTQLAGKYALSIIIVRDLVLGNKQRE
ncbi:MAG: hypothetical protein ACE5DN_02605 [Flavobacteriales bacterium]